MGGQRVTCVCGVSVVVVCVLWWCVCVCVCVARNTMRSIGMVRSHFVCSQAWQDFAGHMLFVFDCLSVCLSICLSVCVSLIFCLSACL